MDDDACDSALEADPIRDSDLSVVAYALQFGDPASMELAETRERVDRLLELVEVILRDRELPDWRMDALAEHVCGVATLERALVNDHDARALFDCHLRWSYSMRRFIDAGPALEEELLDLLRLQEVAWRINEKLDLYEISDPNRALRSILRQLAGVDERDVARLLGVAPKTLHRWCDGATVDRQEERILLLAEVFLYLAGTYSPAELLCWWDRPSRHCDGLSPSALFQRDPDVARERLIAFAAGTRDVGGT